MSADTLKATMITDYDATPVVVHNTGAGVAGPLRNVTDYVTPTTGGLGDTTSTYRMVRLPTNAKLKKLQMTADAALDSSTGLAIDVGAYYSDSTVDGSPVAKAGAVVSGKSACFSAINTGFRSSALGPIDILGAFTVDKRNQPLWQALGLSSDPGGFFDVVVAVHTAATTAVASQFGVNADYVE